MLTSDRGVECGTADRDVDVVTEMWKSFAAYSVAPDELESKWTGRRADDLLHNPKLHGYKFEFKSMRDLIRTRLGPLSRFRQT